MKTKIKYACGCYSIGNGPPPTTKAGLPASIITMVNRDGWGNCRPRIPGEEEKDLRANCILFCPAKAKDSKRQVKRGWIGKTQEEANSLPPCLVATCRPTGWEEINDESKKEINETIQS